MSLYLLLAFISFYFRTRRRTWHLSKIENTLCGVKSMQSSFYFILYLEIRFFIMLKYLNKYITNLKCFVCTCVYFLNLQTSFQFVFIAEVIGIFFWKSPKAEQIFTASEKAMLNLLHNGVPKFLDAVFCYNGLCFKKKKKMCTKRLVSGCSRDVLIHHIWRMLQHTRMSWP